ncbi:MAG: hypothetical protein J6129_00895 [Bacteroidaceae bacterium]|nr:hypothetical protein [Bacteroidaceae bacterium]
MEKIQLNIADFTVELELDEGLMALPKNYRPFVVSSDGQQGGEPLLRMTMCREPVSVEGCEMLSSFDDLGYRQDVYKRAGGGYIFEIYGYDGTLAATMASSPCFEENRTWIAEGDALAKEFGLNNTLMIAYAFASAYHGTLMMHSSVVAKDGVGYMFLGKSGTGKSTHSSLWLRYLDGYHLMNDDNPVLRVSGSEVTVYGSPWSGKTPCYRQEKARVGALVMLEQKPYNKISRESVVVALSSLLCSCSVMIWDRSSYDCIMRTIEQVITLKGVHHLECLPDEAAARLCNETIAK